MNVQIIGNNVVFPNGFIFNILFKNSYKNLNIINVRRKLKKYYTKSQQDMIISFLKDENILKPL